MALAQKGDKAAYRQGLAKTQGLLIGYLLNRVKDQQLAEDLCQETLIKIHTYLSSYDPEKPYLPWMYTIAKHTLIDYFRTKGKKLRALTFVEEADIFPGEEGEAGVALGVSRAFSRLPTGDQELLNKAKRKGQSFEEIGRELGIKPGTIKVRVHRAWARFRKLLNE
jgi:RNA polymerase sigma-70 factor, ECF subfamily